MSSPKLNILFLCTGNSCRSQMAEGFAKRDLGKFAVIRSGGIEAHGINPRAVKSMLDAGVDISQQTSDVVSDIDLGWAHTVITLCGHAKDHCPAIPLHVQHQHWPLSDPAQVTGSEETIGEAFTQVRNEIEHRVKQLGQELE